MAKAPSGRRADAAPAQRRKGELSGSADAAPDERQLFRSAMSDVKPLPQDAAAQSRGRTAPRRVRLRRYGTDLTPGAAAAEPLPEIVAQPDDPCGADTLAFCRPGVRTRTFRHLRRGLYPIESQLDLHGLNQAQARDSLADFLARCRAVGQRCVRIVHGKGYRSGSRGPLLKIAVNTWLKRHPDVMAFASARAIDGGTGAVYVLLRA